MSVSSISPAKFADLCQAGKRLNCSTFAPLEIPGGPRRVCAKRSLDQLDAAQVMQAATARPMSHCTSSAGPAAAGSRPAKSFSRPASRTSSERRRRHAGRRGSRVPVVRGQKAISLERQVRIAAVRSSCWASVWMVRPSYLFGLSAFVGAGSFSPGSPTPAAWECSWRECRGTRLLSHKLTLHRQSQGIRDQISRWTTCGFTPGDFPRDARRPSIVRWGSAGYLATRILRQNGIPAANVGGGYKTYKLFPTVCGVIRSAGRERYGGSGAIEILAALNIPCRRMPHRVAVDLRPLLCKSHGAVAAVFHDSLGPNCRNVSSVTTCSGESGSPSRTMASRSRASSSIRPWRHG